MRRSIAFCAGSAVIAAGAVLGAVRHAGAQALVENSAEFRMQLDFQVKDAALQKMLPAGWEPQVATQGPAKDCNIRLIFIDRVDVTGADNAPKTSSQLVYLAVPVKQTGTTNAGQMIIAGLVADPKELPGPFGNYTPAATSKVQRSVTIDNGVATGEENWVFAAANGERMEVHLKYERGAGRRNPTQEVKFFDPRNPGTYQIFKVDFRARHHEERLGAGEGQGEGVQLQGQRRQSRIAVRRHRKGAELGFVPLVQPRHLHALRRRDFSLSPRAGRGSG